MQKTNKHTTHKTQMKLKHLLTLLAALAITVPAFAQDKDETPLGKEMEKVGKGLKGVNRNLADPAQKDANLAKLAEVKAALEKAATFEPAKAKDVPPAEKAKFIEGYKAGIAESIKGVDALKAAIEAGKADDAAKAMTALNDGKKEGHKKFKKED